MVYFVSRHPGAVEWILQQPQWQIDCFVRHLNPQDIQAGDVVLGTLPLHLAAEVCARGGIFYFLTLLQEEAGRGSEYSGGDMSAMGCALRRFEVRVV